MKRFLALILALLTVTLLFAGCNGKKTGNQGGTAPPDDGTTDLNPPSNTRTWNDLPQDKYDADFVILGRGDTGTWDTVDLAAKEEDTAGNQLSSAVYNRNAAVERRHDVTIKYSPISDDDVAEKLDVFMRAGINDYALYDLTLTTWGAGVIKGYFKNLYEFSELQLDEPWWDQRFVQQLSLYDQIYGVLSDATYVDKMATWATVFNKEMLSAYDITDNPYDLVRNGQWTYESMIAMGKKAQADVDGDGKITLGTKGDVYAIAGETMNIAVFMQGCGMPVAAYEDGDIYLNLADKKEQADTIFKAVYDLVADSEFAYLAEVHEQRWKGGRDFFEAQQSLFFVGGINNLHQYFRAFSYDYGVLPMPKYSVGQTEYYDAVNAYNCPAFAIPSNAENASMSAVVMQAMACRGQNSLVAVFYDTILKGNSVRDADSWEMLDLIFASRSFDLGTIYGLGGFVDGYGGHLIDLIVNKQKDQLSSTIDSFAGTAKDAIEDLVNYYDKNIKQ